MAQLLHRTTRHGGARILAIPTRMVSFQHGQLQFGAGEAEYVVYPRAVKQRVCPILINLINSFDLLTDLLTPSLGQKSILLSFCVKDF